MSGMRGKQHNPSILSIKEIPTFSPEILAFSWDNDGVIFVVILQKFGEVRKLQSSVMEINKTFFCYLKSVWFWSDF